MNDNDKAILQIILNKNGTINGNKVNRKYLETHQDINDYLLLRYPDSTSIKETVYRMKHNIENRPVCKQCGKPVKYVSLKLGFSTFCGAHCAAINEETKEKLKNTNMSKYGVEHNWQNKECREKCLKTTIERYGSGNNYEKILQTNKERYGTCFSLQNPESVSKLKQTNIDRYGTDCIFKSKQFQEKIKTTWISKYGKDNPAKSDIIIEKTKKTNLDKYGTTSPLQNPEIRNKTIKTQQEKYNGKLFVQTEEFQIKSDKTKLLHNSYSSSKIEQQFKKYLESIYIVKYQYKSEKYPFNCDFYIPNLDLYIEIQANWMHGKHPYNENDENDVNLINSWKSKSQEINYKGVNKSAYNTAIKTWSISDVHKRTMAKENNLNYLEIFSNNLNECISQLNNYIKSNYNI